MLILTRKKNQKIVVRTKRGERLDLMVVDIDTQGRGSVRLGVDAPKDWSIHREEIDRKVNNATQDTRGYGLIGPEEDTAVGNQ